MGFNGEWDAQKMLDLYLHDYMIKNNMHEAAEIFRKETGFSPNPVVINASRGFLHEWWTLFYDMYNSSQTKYQDENGQQVIQNNLHTMHQSGSQVQMNQPQNEQFLSDPDLNRMLRKPVPTQLLAKIYEGEQSRPISTEHDPSFRYVNPSEPSLPNSPVSSSSNLQQQFRNQAQQSFLRVQDNRKGFSFRGVMNQEPAFWGTQEGVSPKTKPQGTAMSSRGINSVPLKRNTIDTQNQQWQFEGISHIPRKYECAFPGRDSKMVHDNLTLPKSNAWGRDPTKVKRQKVAQTSQKAEKNQEQNQIQREPLAENGGRRKTPSLSKTEGKTADCIITQKTEPANESIHSYLFHDDRDAAEMFPAFGNLRNISAASDKEEQEGLTFEEVGCLHSSKGKVLCSHFSSDGKLLASAGLEKKVLIWYTETFDFINTSEGHSALITDVRFRSNSNILATSSFDTTVKIWDATQPIKLPVKLQGHSEHVMSLDFHPRQLDLLCSCDSNGEIRYWNINNSACARVSKGATKQVRFQSDLGQLLATAAGNRLNIIDVEKNAVLISLEGHEKEVSSICWDPSGQYIVSVSEDSAQVWSPVTQRECMYKLLSNGDKFQSCTFHPAYSQCLTLGGYQKIELWNPAKSNKTLKVEAHKGLVSSLSYSQETKMVASTSHDRCVKLWK